MILDPERKNARFERPNDIFRVQFGKSDKRTYVVLFSIASQILLAVSRADAAQSTLHGRVVSESGRPQPHPLQLQVHIQVDDDAVPGVRAHRADGVRLHRGVLDAPRLRDVPR